MLKRATAVLFAATLFFLQGCGTQEASRIYTVCKSTEKVTYVYNGSGEFFMYSDGKVTPCYEPSLQARPRLVLIFDDVTEFKLTPEIPSVYVGGKSDAVHYITKLLLEDNGMYRMLNIDWKSFEALVTSDNYEVRILYTDDDKVRVYATDKYGNAVTPPYL